MPIDLDTSPVWRFDNETDTFFPLDDLDTFIDSIDELHFKAKFTSPQGFEFFGTLTGKGETAIAIYRNNRWYAANKNFRQTTLSQLDALARESVDIGVNSGRDLLPLSFETEILQKPYVDWSGTFDI